MSPVRFTPAKRENVPLLLGFAGGTGSGKTNSALRVATGLAGDKPFAVIDSEARRALHYADQFNFDHAVIEAPFRPQTYADAIKAADEAGYPVIVVDSASHEWDGPGGMLDWHDEIMGGNERKKLTAWIQPKSEHRKFINQLLQLRAHVVLCFRAAEKVDMVKVGGKWEIIPKKSLTGLDGWIPICEKSLPFELTLSLLLTADRPGVPHPIKLQEQHRPFVPLDAPLTEQTGVALGRWAAGGDGQQTDSEALEAELSDLTDRALAVTPDDAKDARRQNIEAAREKFHGDMGAYLAWLGAQVDRLEAEAAAAAQEALTL